MFNSYLVIVFIGILLFLYYINSSYNIKIKLSYDCLVDIIIALVCEKIFSLLNVWNTFYHVYLGFFHLNILPNRHEETIKRRTTKYTQCKNYLNFRVILTGEEN